MNMNFKVLTVAIALLFFTTPAFASGPGTSQLRFDSIEEIENINGNFRIRGSRPGSDAQVEISGSANSYTDFVTTQFATDLFNETTRRALSLVLDISFATSGATEITPDGSVVSFLGGVTITKARIVKHVPFTDGQVTNSKGSLLGASLVLLNANNTYVIRGYDVEGNFSQIIGNVTNNPAAKECVAKMSATLVTDDLTNKKNIWFGGDIRAAGDSVGIGVRGTATSFANELTECRVVKSDHLIGVAN